MMGLFEFANVIGAKVTVNGEVYPEPHINVHLEKDHRSADVIQGGMLRGAYGRSNSANLWDALEDLCCELSNTTITFQSYDENRQTYNVPQLTVGDFADYQKIHSDEMVGE
jgi:hypothetical protein